uniref:Fibrous sheath-interacting protein 1 n=1 Tax=Timema bartmani TaxID=61472 RepID=A0A7R9EP81_9NEOP|nr:unnamed protein product [Timema bartmani]
MSASPENSHFPLPEALKTLGSLQIERLKKEDDEEQWISGEELCTEGSSDEDDTTLRSKRRGGAKNHRKPHKGGKRLHKLPPKLLEPGGTQEETKALEPTPQFLAPADISSAETSPTPARKLEEVVDSPLQCSSDTCDLFTKKEAEELEISWRPKRGSIKLPNLTPEAADSGSELYVNINNDSEEDSVDNVLRSDITSENRNDSDNECEVAADCLDVNRAGVDRRNHVRNTLLCHSNTTSVRRLSAGMPHSQEENFFNNSDSNVKSAFLKMKVLDALLQAAENKEREAERETLKSQLSVRQELEQLQDSQLESLVGELARNSHSFFKLCPYSLEKNGTKEECSIKFSQFDVVGKLDDDELNVSNKDEGKGFIEIHEEKGISNFEIEFNIKENISPDTTPAETENKEKIEVSKKKPAHFVLRNIKLAASGMGTLAITDKEKQQLERLMHDIDTDCNEKIGNTAQELGFKMDTQSQSTIQQIELQLKSLQADTSVHDIATLHSDETDSLEAKIDSNLEDARIKQRLQEIDKTLALLAVCSTQVIQPLTTEKIQKLLDNCQSTSISSRTLESSDISIGENTISEHSPCQCMFGPHTSVDEGDTVPAPYFPALSQEVVQQLVEEAKGFMPFFQFRHSL